MSRWYESLGLDPRAVISVSPTGYSNDELSLEWIRHFDQHTKATANGRKRLLLIDGHGSHHTRQFIEYADMNNIMLFGLPPHTTHILQPLDVVVFQPYKHYHATALDLLVRDGIYEITKLEFLAIIEDVRQKAFKESTVLSAFRKTGIWPYKPQVVWKMLEERTGIIEESTPTRHLASSPFSTPQSIRKMNRVAERISTALDAYMTNDEPLSPTVIHGIHRFMHGSITQSTELIQVKADLGRTRMAEEQRQARRRSSNRPLQTGGVLTVADGREMVERKKENDKEM